MGWESRGPSERKYYTRSRRRNGRVIREYVGTGPAAMQEAKLDDLRRQKLVELRRIRIQELSRQIETHRECDRLLAEVKQLELVILSELGFYLHRGQLRLGRIMTTRAISVWDKLRKADFQNPDSIQAVREELAGPNRQMILDQAGDLARQCERMVFSNLAQNQQGAELAIREKLADLRLKLAPSNPIEELIVDRVVQCWLQLHMAEVIAMKQTTPSKAHESRVDSLNRRYLNALKTLSIVRARTSKIRKSLSIRIAASSLEQR